MPRLACGGAGRRGGVSHRDWGSVFGVLCLRFQGSPQHASTERETIRSRRVLFSSSLLFLRLHTGRGSLLPFGAVQILVALQPVFSIQSVLQDMHGFDDYIKSYLLTQYMFTDYQEKN